MTGPNVNDFSRINRAENATWVDPHLDTGDGLVEEIAPTVYVVANLEGIAQTCFGPFLGSVAFDGYAGLRPVITTEMEAVVEAMEEEPSESVFIEGLTIPPEDAWRNFFGRSTQDMMDRVIARVTGQAVSKVNPIWSWPDDTIEGHFLHVAQVVSPEPVITYDPHANTLDDVDARVDVLELFGLDESYGTGDREDLARLIRELNANLDRPDYLANRAALVVEPLTEIIRRIDSSLPEIERRV